MSGKSGKKRWILIAVAVVVIIALIAGLLMAGANGKDSANGQGTVEFVAKRTIANSISGNGVVEAANSEDVTGGSYGMKVEKVNVEVGDTVAKGDVICIFDTTDIDTQISDLQTRINDTEADRKEQNESYDERISDSKENREKQLTTARENLAKAEDDLAKAEAELAKKQAEYDTYIAGGGSSSSLEAIQMESVIETKKSNVETIKVRVENYESQIEDLENADDSTTEDAKRTYNDQIDSTIDSLEDQIKRYKEQKDDAVIKAGMDGTITAVNVTEGSSFSGGVIASIEGMDHFVIEAQVEEYDIPDVAVGMKVLIKTDATREEELEGVVTYVAPRATNSGSTSGLSSLMSGMDTSSFTNSSNSATYLVKIELKEQNTRLRLGMNARTSIIVEEKTDVWSVPYDAVHTRTDGSTYLEEVTGKDEEGNLITKELDVKVGIQGTYYVEVIADSISEETQILIPNASGNSSIEELLNMMGAGAGI